MATAENVVTLTAEAGSAITIYRALVLATDGQYDHAGADAFCDGISVEAAALAGDQFAMAQLSGILKLEAGGNVTVGAKIASNASGQGVVAGAAGAGKYILGRARTAAASGEIFELVANQAANQA